jgi:hypothetical protein
MLGLAPSRTPICWPRWSGCPIPRKTRGPRHRLVTVLASRRSWPAPAPTSPSRNGPTTCRPPAGSGWAWAAVRRVSPRSAASRRIVDLDALDTALSGWLTARLPAPPAARPGPARPVVRMIAVDGKTAPGCPPRRGQGGPSAGGVRAHPRRRARSNRGRREDQRDHRVRNPARPDRPARCAGHR